MIQTYRDPQSGKIVTETGEQILNLDDYGRRVRAGEISGQPKDISLMPKVIRTPDGGIGTKTSIADKLSNVDRFKSNTQFLEAAKEIIRRKSEIQQPISEAKTYWRTLQRDTSPFGGMRDANLEIPGMFTDARLRELSPAEQASVQASRDAAASAHLQGINEEEQYRGKRAEDMVQAMSDLLAEKDKIAESYGATKGVQATDGGYFAIFPDLATGEKARRDLLLGTRYQSLSADNAMKVWSGGVSTTPTAQDKVGFNVSGLGKRYLNDKGYTYQKLVSLGAPAISKPFSSFTEDEWAQLESAWKRAEGWKEGTTLGQDKGIEHVTWTEAAVRGLAAKLPGMDSTTLWNTKTDSELDALSKEASGDIIQQVISKLKPAALLRIGLTQDNAREILTLKQMGMSDEEIKTMMGELNLNPKILDELNSLLTSQENSSDILALFASMASMQAPGE